MSDDFWYDFVEPFLNGLAIFLVCILVVAIFASFFIAIFYALTDTPWAWIYVVLLLIPIAWITGKVNE